MKNAQLLFAFCICLFCSVIKAQQSESPRKKINFNREWKYAHGDVRGAERIGYNDSGWETVGVPHSFSIPYFMSKDFYVGYGWYRKSFRLSEDDLKKCTFIEFDGVFQEAEIYINGQKVGSHVGGYTGFSVDVTKAVKAGNNEMAVRVNNIWKPDVAPRAGEHVFSGGIYRNVRLVQKSKTYIDWYGTFVITPELKENRGKASTVKVATEVCNRSSLSSEYKLVTEVRKLNGEAVTSVTTTEYVGANDCKQFVQVTPAVNEPELWHPAHPSLYKLVSLLYKGNELLDSEETVFGFRWFEWTADRGFFLNGEHLFFKGANVHQDQAGWGDAVTEAAMRRDVKQMKEAGFDFIRGSHYPHAPAFSKACDEMGMMLMPESFDEWKSAKMANGYHKIFDEWVEKDLVNLIRHYRNNPSVVMWCIGNEVPDQWNGNNGPKLSRMLQDICHREDPTRPVTQGMDAPDAVVNNNMAATMDIAGFNYRPHKYPENYKKLPQQIVLGSETASTVSSRGVYKFPVTRQAMKKYDDHQSSSYDVEHCGWSNLPEDDWIWHDDKPWAIGEFVWTGFDYLGEPTPYYTDWRSHSSLFGIIDLAGLPKDRYYLYRSHWNKDEETLHILPHWTWPGREGEVTPIFVYTNYPSAEVFINGKSQGKRTKDLSVTPENSADSASTANFKRQQRYRLMWMDTKYEPGTVKVVAYNDKGEAVAEKEIHTAGKPDHIELVADRNEIKADGKDLSFVTVRVVDKDGNLCPDAQHLIKYSVKGAGTYRAGANGDPTSIELFHLPQMKVFNGMMTAIVQSTDKPGEITLTATGKGLKSGKLVLMSK